MHYIVRVTDYYYGGHVLYVILVNECCGYTLTNDRRKASVFRNTKQLLDIVNYLVNDDRRTVEKEQIVDNEVLNQLVDI